MPRLARLLFVGLLVLAFSTPETFDGAARGYGEHVAPRARIHAVAATDHPSASQAAADILAQGGTAADAAAAAMLTLGVVSPASSGFGGGGFALYYRASDRSMTFLDFRERAPAAATATMFEEAERANPGSHPSEVGGLAVAVPGEPAGIEALVQRFGRLPLRVSAASAIALARRGPVPSAYLRAHAPEAHLADLRRDGALRGWFGRRGTTGFGTRTRMRQPGLAAALAAFARGGSSAIYRGAIAERIVADVRAHGGILTLEDLAAYRVVEREPLHETFFGHEWWTAPPPSAGGATLLASLDFLERALAGRTGSRDDLLHAWVESWKGPFLDRQAAFGDPDHVDVPLAALRAEARRRARFARFDPAHATPAPAYAMPIGAAEAFATPSGGGTSHLCIVDAEGNVASVTTTVNLTFGARFAAGGILMNDEMDDFARAVGEANAFGLVGGARNRPGPGRRPVSSMTPTIVLGPLGAPRLCIGAAGGSRIPTATAQVAYGIVVEHRQPRDAIGLARVHHQATPDVVTTERAVPQPADRLAALAARGHAFDTLEHVAIVQLVAFNDDGTVEGAADPRKGGTAVAPPERPRRNARLGAIRRGE